MRWDRSHRSQDVEDRRGEGVGGGAGGLGGLAVLLPLAGRFGWRGLLLVGVVFLLVRGAGTCAKHSAPHGGGFASGYAPAEHTAGEDELERFVGFVFDDVQSSWRARFERDQAFYRPAKLVLFSDAVSTGCGLAPAAAGPFYCPADEKVYIDLTFYRELRRRFGAPGDFAQAYVIAHEVGHHVEHLRGALAPRDGRDSIGQELLADCLAGVWAKGAATRDLLEPGDLEEAIHAAAAVGDDRIQEQATGQVTPETWTHGSADERTRAFRHGYEAGDGDGCGLPSIRPI
jgi:predicted metalloprotease